MTGWALDFTSLAAIWGSSFLFTRLGVVEFRAHFRRSGVRRHYGAVGQAMSSASTN